MELLGEEKMQLLPQLVGDSSICTEQPLIYKCTHDVKQAMEKLRCSIRLKLKV